MLLVIISGLMTIHRWPFAPHVTQPPSPVTTLNEILGQNRFTPAESADPIDSSMENGSELRQIDALIGKA